MVIDTLARFREERGRRCIPSCSVDEIPDCRCLEEYIFYQMYTLLGCSHSVAMARVTEQYGAKGV